MPGLQPAAAPAFRPWREPQFALLAVLAFAIYGTRMTSLTVRGEESRWARVACEMIDRGDWVVPRQQGAVFADRPPLGSWAIAVSMLVLGDHGPLAVRIPTILATVATSLLIYAYCRRFLSALGAFAAGVAFATAGQVLELGRFAESEGLFTFFVAASLLTWNWGYESKWPPWRIWTAGYSLAALAALAKGAQGPVYFVAACAVHLACRRDWRFLFGRAHAAGIAAFAAIVLGWQIPFAVAVGWPLALRTWSHLAAARFDYSSTADVVQHLVTYPVEVLACLLPWSVLLAAFARRALRRELGVAAPYVGFLAGAILAAFPTCWLATHARSRYFMPLYPCFAPLVGLVVERAAAAGAATDVGKLWRRFLGAMAGLMLVASAAIALASWRGIWRESVVRQPPIFAVAYCLMCAGLALGLVRAAKGPTGRAALAGVVLVATFVGATSTGVWVNILQGTSEDTAGAVARLKARLPGDTRLISLGAAHHAFTYHYHEPIPMLPWPAAASEVDDALDFFCFDDSRNARPALPFEWELVAVVPCDRNRRDEPVEKVVVGRRLRARAWQEALNSPGDPTPRR